MSTPPRTARGNRTRAKILAAAEQVFADLGYHEASIVKITEAAGVAMGTFYLYFDGKHAVFTELVDDLNQRVRHAMNEASSQATTRLEAERAGFRAFFRFTAEHPALYRVIRQAEFVAPDALRRHYQKIVSGYVTGLEKARADDEVGDVDPTVAAWALMGIGEIVGMRWVLWGGADGPADAGGPGADGRLPEIPDDVFDQTMLFIERALAPHRAPSPGPAADDPTQEGPTP